MRFTATGNQAERTNDLRTTPPSSVEFPVNRFTGNSNELGGVVRESALVSGSGESHHGMHAIARFSAESVRLSGVSATGNSTERTNIIPDVDSRSSAREA